MFGHGPGDLVLAHDGDAGAQALQMLHLGIEMRAGNDGQARGGLARPGYFLFFQGVSG